MCKFLSVAVCDDMPLECSDIANRIELMLKQMNMEFVIKRFFGGQELLGSEESFDIIFLDIEMPETNGMNLAKELRSKETQSLIIFITAFSQYVFEAYDVEAFHYLVKPIKQEKLKRVLEKAVKKSDNNSEDFLIISTERKTKKLLLRDILYIESVGRIAKIHCKGCVMETYEQIGVLEEKLRDKFFFRCHKSFLVNLAYVDTFNKTDICMENGDKIMVAKRRLEEFQKEILSYMKMRGGIL